MFIKINPFVMFAARISTFAVLSLFCAPALAVPKVQEVKTPAGMTAWLVEDHHVPIVSLRLVFRESGAAYAPASVPAGAPLLAMQMLSQGAGTLSKEQFDAALQERAVSLDFTTGYDEASVSLDALSERLEEGMRLMSLALTKPTLAKSDLDRVRQEQLSQLRLEMQDPDYLADQLFRQTIYGTHPYAKPLLGSEASLRTVTAQTLRSYLQTALRRDHLVIAVSGDITPERLAALLDQYLGPLPAGKGEVQALPHVALPVQSVANFQKAPFPQAVAVFALPGLPRKDPQFYAAYLMNYMLGGGGFDSRLTDKVRRERGLTYSIATGLSIDDASWLLEGGMATQAARAKEALALVGEVITTARDQGFTEQELERAKNYITGSFALNIDSNSELANFLITMQMDELGIDYLEKRNALMQAVTLQEVNQVATQLLKPEKLVQIVIGDFP